MSSPLEARIRSIALEVTSEAAAELLANLEEKVAALGARVEELETAATAAPTTAKRAAVARKGTSE